MRAVIRDIWSPQIEDLERFEPDTPDDFALIVQVLVGPEKSEGEESFDVTVCSPKWLAREVPRNGIYWPRHHLIMHEWSLAVLRSFLERKVAGIEQPTWSQIAEHLSRIGYWEFEDYVHHDERSP